MGKKGFWLLNVAMPRGLAAGVLATLPLHRGIEGVENLASAVFALIVFSVLFFAAGFSVVSRFAEGSGSKAEVDVDKIATKHN